MEPRHPAKRNLLRRAAVLSCWLLLCGSLRQLAAVDLTRMSLEELMSVEVSLVSRRPEPLANTPAAASVVSGEELRRSGAQLLPDALRLIPGMQVAGIDANKWAITARGFAGLFANKLLVLVDGRSVYTPLFSGVFWEAQDLILSDVERLEVIRGPGGTLWGTNAVNGIINLVTLPAAATQGWMLQMAGGFPTRTAGTLRYGGRIGERFHFRAYGKGRFAGSSPLAEGAGRGHDAWSIWRTGGRLDGWLSARDELTLSADLYAGQAGQTLSLATDLLPPYTELVETDATLKGGSLTGHWRRTLDDREALDLRFYFDRAERGEQILRGAINTFDLDLQHQVPLAARIEMTWGLGYRHIADDFTGSFTMALTPPGRTTHLLSGFLHTDIALRPERLRLSLGAKLERNTYTGLELQPNCRLRWSPRPSQLLWMAVSRAARIPSRSERDFRGTVQVLAPDQLFPGAPVTRIELLGDADFTAEKLTGWEIGYRAGHRDLALDVTLFYNRYADLRTNEPGLPHLVEEPVPHLVVPVAVANKGRGRTLGGEGTLDWRGWRRWHLSLAYSYLHMRLKVDESSLDATTPTFADDAPRHQLSLRSRLAFSPRLEFDATGRFVDRLASMDIDPYLTFDLRLAYRPVQTFELSVTGRDLLDSPHPEFISSAARTLPMQVERSLYLAAIWHWGKPWR